MIKVENTLIAPSNKILFCIVLYLKLFNATVIYIYNSLFILFCIQWHRAHMKYLTSWPLSPTKLLLLPRFMISLVLIIIIVLTLGMAGIKFGNFVTSLVLNFSYENWFMENFLLMLFFTDWTLAHSSYVLFVGLKRKLLNT